jgi:hypothetical protein
VTRGAAAAEPGPEPDQEAANDDSDIAAWHLWQWHGVAEGKTPLGGQPPNIRRKLSKAELREQAAAAFLAWREGQKAKDK